MMLTYGLAVIIVGIWLLKIINHKSLIFNRTPLDIPLFLFLVANIASTIFSIDQHTSIWGYYSRSNGGLLSLISYLLLYFAFTSNINKDQSIKLLKIGVFSATLIAIWGIFEHFGVSPSCVILRQEFNATCWVQDVQARVFATLGQPNWLAAYLAMLIFPCIYFILTAPNTKQLFTFYFLLITLYMAFTFTYSRGGFLGFLTGMLVFSSFWLVQNRNILLLKRFWSRPLLLILFTFLLINLLFGSALTRFNLSQLLPQQTQSTPGVESSNTPGVGGTQLESGGGESGKIRLIVWRGALDIFKAYPFFGSGVETFAYSYYHFRPVSHNLVSEWDFLYNKAHNEFLNYLATTGIVGFGTYMLVIGVFIVWCIRHCFIIPSKARDDKLLILAILASYISYLVQNFFGFSVVIIAIFFFLFPAIAFVATSSTKKQSEPKLISYLISHISYRSVYIKALQLVVLLVTCYLLISLARFWIADTLFASGQRELELNNPGRAYNLLTDAISINKLEPYYRSELGYAAAAASLALEDVDATLSAELKNEAVSKTEKVLKESPKNVSFWRTAVRAYFELSSDEAFIQKTLESLDQAILLAPTDPKLLYNKAVILGEVNRNQEAIKALQKAINLKPNYRDAFYALALFQFDAKNTEDAVIKMNKVLSIVSNDPEALEKLNEWGKMGIATKSGTRN